MAKLKMIICLVIGFILVGVMVACQRENKIKNHIIARNNESEIENLISKMTIEEKVHQIAIQYSNANMRLGIPNLCANECLHGIRLDSATVFPQAMTSTWEPELIEQMGHVVAKESRALGVHQCYSPMISVVRDAR